MPSACPKMHEKLQSRGENRVFPCIFLLSFYYASPPNACLNSANNSVHQVLLPRCCRARFLKSTYCARAGRRLSSHLFPFATHLVRCERLLRTRCQRTALPHTVRTHTRASPRSPRHWNRAHADCASKLCRQQQNVAHGVSRGTTHRSFVAEPRKGRHNHCPCSSFLSLCLPTINRLGTYLPFWCPTE